MSRVFSRQSVGQLVELEVMECAGCSFSFEAGVDEDGTSTWECAAPNDIPSPQPTMTLSVVPEACPLRRGPILVRLGRR